MAETTINVLPSLFRVFYSYYGIVQVTGCTSQQAQVSSWDALLVDFTPPTFAYPATVDPSTFPVLAVHTGLHSISATWIKPLDLESGISTTSLTVSVNGRAITDLPDTAVTGIVQF